MDKVQLLEEQVRELTEAELAAFLEWFDDFDAQLWDKQLEADVAAGKLDALADAALKEHAKGRTTRL